MNNYFFLFFFYLNFVFGNHSYIQNIFNFKDRILSELSNRQRLQFSRTYSKNTETKQNLVFSFVPKFRKPKSLQSKMPFLINSAPLGRGDHRVAMSVCLSVFVCLRHRETPTSGGRVDLWSKIAFLILVWDDTI